MLRFANPPLLQVPLKGFHCKLLLRMSLGSMRRPRMRRPSSSGDSRKMENMIKLKTAAMTSRAMNMPRQLRRSGDMATSSCKQRGYKIMINKYKKCFMIII